LVQYVVIGGNVCVVAWWSSEDVEVCVDVRLKPGRGTGDVVEAGRTEVGPVAGAGDDDMIGVEGVGYPEISRSRTARG